MDGSHLSSLSSFINAHQQWESVDTKRCPVSDSKIREVVLEHYHDNKAHYERHFDEVDCTGGLSTDHTFKVVSNAGYTHEGQWCTAFKALLIVMTSSGFIKDFKLCDTTAYEKVENVFERIAKNLERKGERTRFIIIDNCCS